MKPEGKLLFKEGELKEKMTRSLSQHHILRESPTQTDTLITFAANGNDSEVPDWQILRFEGGVVDLENVDHASLIMQLLPLRQMIRNPTTPTSHKEKLLADYKALLRDVIEISVSKQKAAERYRRLNLLNEKLSEIHEKAEQRLADIDQRSTQLKSNRDHRHSRLVLYRANQMKFAHQLGRRQLRIYKKPLFTRRSSSLPPTFVSNKDSQATKRLNPKQMKHLQFLEQITKTLKNI
jgi:hypothetical protein